MFHYYDGHCPYQTTIPLVFKFNVDFAQITKRFGRTSESDQRRYSPAQIVSVDKTMGCGKPDMDNVCTFHVERLNQETGRSSRRP